ncbi:MAG: hypothetical protein JKY37_11755, partial [Nannocystaceae bacterium]|nr:hypothetical protein [Nannocystaceae bacterium]
MRGPTRWLAAILLLLACDNAGTDAESAGAVDANATQQAEAPPTNENADTRNAGVSPGDS